MVICAYTENRWTDLRLAVEAVQAQTLPPEQLIVVIDHNPELLERARATFPGACVLANTQARGLSGARNSGLAAACGAVVAFVDEDAVPATDWLERLVRHYDDPRVLGVGGEIEPWWETGRPYWFPEEFDWVVGCTYRGMPAGTAAVRNLIGCNMSFRRSVFEQVGGFRNGIGRVGTLPVGCEETELCIRVQQHYPRHVLLFEPGARVRHRVPAVRSEWNYFRARCYAEGISKAQIAGFVGAEDALSSERQYTARTLPLGVARNLAGLIRGDMSGLARAGVIAAGLGLTAAGYLRGKARPRALGFTEMGIEADMV